VVWVRGVGAWGGCVGWVRGVDAWGGCVGWVRVRATMVWLVSNLFYDASSVTRLHNVNDIVTSE
jgi:hypothetical protein